MTESPAEQPARRARAFGLALLLVAALVVVPVVVGVVVVRSVFTSDGPPSCDAPPVTLTWTEGERGWLRSEAFTLDEVQTVQVDVRLFDPDGGFIQVGTTVYAVPAGEPFPDFGETAGTTPTTDPFPGVRVGHGREAVNKQVELSAGDWELILDGVAAPAEVRWPC